MVFVACFAWVVRICITTIRTVCGFCSFSDRVGAISNVGSVGIVCVLLDPIR